MCAQRRLGVCPGPLRRRRPRRRRSSRLRSSRRPPAGSAGVRLSRPPLAVALAGLACLRGPGDGPGATGTRGRSLPPACSGTCASTSSPSLFASSLGLSVMLGNWVVTLLSAQGGMTRGRRCDRGAHARTRGRLASARRLDPACPPGAVRAAVGASLVAGRSAPCCSPRGAARARRRRRGAGRPRGRASRSLPRSPARRCLRPDAPAAAVGLVNGAASAVDPRRGRRCSGSRSRSREGEGPVSSSWPSSGSPPCCCSRAPAARQPTSTGPDRVQDDLGRERRVRRVGVLERRMADAVPAGDEDHRAGDVVGHAHRVVCRAGGHQHERLARRARGLLERGDDPGVERRRRRGSGAPCTRPSCRASRARCAKVAMSRATPR